MLKMVSLVSDAMPAVTVFKRKTFKKTFRLFLYTVAHVKSHEVS